MFLEVRDARLAKVLREAQESMQVLIKGCVEFTIVDLENEVPVGCVSENMGPSLAVHLLVKVCPPSSSFLQY